MLIPVIYPNGSHDLVKDFYLDYLIDAEKIDRFKRGDGWVSLSSGNVRRRKNKPTYSGPERRQIFNQNQQEKSDILNVGLELSPPTKHK